MSHDSNISIATSIAPFNISLQQEAIKTWIALGFSVISVNNPKEIAEISPHFPGVRFVEACRDARAVAGKPFIYFDDILAALWESKSSLCGIVNSDIHLRTDIGVYQFVAREAQDALLFGTRLDVTSMEDLTGEENTFGFDYFFFNRNLISLYTPTDFCLGAPWWDTWALLVPILSGVQVKQLVTPIAFHLYHITKWSELYEHYGGRLVSHLEDFCLAKGLPNDSYGRLSKLLCEPSGVFHALQVIGFALGRAEKVYYGDKPAAQRRPYELEQFLKMLSQLQAVLREQETQRTVLSNQLNAVKHSLSWRVTRPLRWLKIVLRKITELIDAKLDGRKS